jgi:hypothetical protein
MEMIINNKLEQSWVRPGVRVMITVQTDNPIPESIWRGDVSRLVIAAESLVEALGNAHSFEPVPGNDIECGRCGKLRSAH